MPSIPPKSKKFVFPWYTMEIILITGLKRNDNIPISRKNSLLKVFSDYQEVKKIKKLSTLWKNNKVKIKNFFNMIEKNDFYQKRRKSKWYEDF